MLDPTYPLFPVLSFLGSLLVLVPLPWHLQAWNSGTCYYMIWTSLACLNGFVNSVVWRDDAINRSPIWCDISIRIVMGASVGIPMSSLCIVRRLYYIAKVQSVGSTKAERRRAALIDSLLCVLFPLLFIAMQFISQGHRFDIVEQAGCWSAMYITPVLFVTSSMWPVLIGTASAFYCIATLFAFRRRQADFNRFFSTNKSFTISRYFRLMALATVETMCTTPIAVYVMVLNGTIAPINPWISWEDTHFGFNRVDTIPAALWRSHRVTVIAIELARWSSVFCAFVFFAFFGFADEARRHYRATFLSVMSRLGLAKYLPDKEDSFAKPGLPSFVQKPLKLPGLVSSRSTISGSTTKSAEPSAFKTSPPPVYTPRSDSITSVSSTNTICYKATPDDVPTTPITPTTPTFSFAPLTDCSTSTLVIPPVSSLPLQAIVAESRL